MASKAPVIPVFVLDDAMPGAHAMGGASCWWLHGSLATLAASLEKRGSRLILRRGGMAAELTRLAVQTKAEAVHITRRYEPWARALEAHLKASLEAEGVALKRYGGGLLVEPEDVRTQSSGPFKVFTPFWRAASALVPERAIPPVPKAIPAPENWPKSDTLADWGLLPTRPDWAGGMRASWTPGEAAAEARLETFIGSALTRYRDERDIPGTDGTSRLSPHLHFGEISPLTIWQRTRHASAADPRLDTAACKFLAEVGWREFSYHLLMQFPDLPEKPFRKDFSDFPWANDRAALHAWQKGLTGYPIVDAGMRQLRQTGWMHNRVRMVVASFLVKHLLIPWQAGEAWFWDNLVDADLAANAASWQWVAGCGADAAPYFRVFNPVLQGAKFDPEGSYVREFVPELAKVPAAHIHAPWEAPKAVLSAAGVALGKTYPAPMVEHAKARQAALDAFATIKARSAQ